LSQGGERQNPVAQARLPHHPFLVEGTLAISIWSRRLGFRSSDVLGGAYGIAVTGTMTVDTVLAFTYFRLASRWRLWPLAPLFGLFLLVDLSFFAANLLKIEEGGLVSARHRRRHVRRDDDLGMGASPHCGSAR
jgi:K+ potassium transporter